MLGKEFGGGRVVVDTAGGVHAMVGVAVPASRTGSAHADDALHDCADSFLWIPYLVIAVWAGLVGSWWQCGVAVAGIVSILAMQVPYWTNMPRERWHHQRGTSHETASDDHRQTARSADAEPTANPPQASGDTYHLMTLNCRYGKASADAIIAAVRERHIDVLALQELSTDLIKRLERGGLHRILPIGSSVRPAKRPTTAASTASGRAPSRNAARMALSRYLRPTCRASCCKPMTAPPWHSHPRTPNRRCAAVGNGRTASGP